MNDAIATGWMCPICHTVWAPFVDRCGTAHAIQVVPAASPASTVVVEPDGKIPAFLEKPKRGKRNTQIDDDETPPF